MELGVKLRTQIKKLCICIYIRCLKDLWTTKWRRSGKQNRYSKRQN